MIPSYLQDHFKHQQYDANNFFLIAGPCVVESEDLVMEIGEKILFLKNGVKAWEGTKQEIFKTDNAAIVEFVYSSNLFKKVREAVLNGH